MFDLGFSELLLTAVVALLVLGPERLPRAAKMGGLMLRRARASWFSVKSQFERELADEELKRSLRDTSAEFEGLRKELQAPLIEPARAVEPAPLPPADQHPVAAIDASPGQDEAPPMESADALPPADQAPR